MNRIRFWPHGVLVVAAVAVVAGIGTALWFKYERSAQASSLPSAARIERVEGQVGINQTADNTNNAQWVEATPNMPVSVGDRIYTKDNSRTHIAFTGRNFATIDANTSIDMLDLSEARTQVALREGSALFDVGSISSGQLFEVATPCGAVDFHQPGIYQIIINEGGSATATAYSGEAEIVGQQGTGKIEKGESLAVSCQGSSNAVISRVDANQAGTVIDNYYRYRYPKKYDGRYRSYYTYLDDPYYYDPARQFSSYNYVSDYIPGIDDLDYYGDWQNVGDYGYCWRPHVASGWAPYQSGYWTMDYPYGLTWVSDEPWGYAPYHYGRWTYVSDEWYWVPQAVNTYPTYSPALVAFIPFSNSSVAWVALGPGDPYVNRYYDPYWQPTYSYPSNIVIDRVVNETVPGAVAVVPTQQFVNVIDPRMITRADPQTFTRVRPVLDPLTVDPWRNVAFQTRGARAHLDVPRQVEQRLNNTAVIAASAPTGPAFKRDLARSLRVEAVSARMRDHKLQINDQRAQVVRQQSQPGQQQSSVAAEQARERQVADLARQAARGDRTAKQQMQELRRQQFAQPGRIEGARAQGEVQATRVSQPAQMRPQDQRQQLRQQRQAQREAARPQIINPSQQRAPQVQRAQGRALRSAQPQIVRPQAQPQRRENRPQYQRQAQPRTIAQPQQARPQRVERAAPRAQPMRQQQVRPQAQPQRVERAAPRAQPMRQQQVRPQAQPRPQQQAQPRPQMQKQPKGPPASKGPEQKGGGRKKP